MSISFGETAVIGQGINLFPQVHGPFRLCVYDGDEFITHSMHVIGVGADSMAVIEINEGG